MTQQFHFQVLIQSKQKNINQKRYKHLYVHCTQYVSKFGKFSSGHRTGKGQFSFQSQRRAMRKNVQTAVQLHSFHFVAKMLKILQARLQQYMNQ